MRHEIWNGLLTVLAFLDKHQNACMVVLTFMLFLCAVISCYIAAKNLRLMKWLDVKRSLPYVVLETTQNIPFYGVRLVNLGQTAARNVKVVTSPKIEMLFGSERKPIRFLEECVAVLVPNGMCATDFCIWNDLEKSNPSLVYRCTVTYESEWGEKMSNECVLDYSLYDGLAYPVKKTMTDLIKQFETFSRDFNHFATGFHKPHVLIEDYDKYREKVERQLEERRAALAARKSSAATQRGDKEEQCGSDEKGSLQG